MTFIRLERVLTPLKKSDMAAYGDANTPCSGKGPVAVPWGGRHVHTLLLQDKIGASSEKTGLECSFSGKNDSLSKYYGFYLDASKE
jgi:hypothetical protein